MQQAAIAQVVERRIGNAEVTGPTPVSSLSFRNLFWSFFWINKKCGAVPDYDIKESVVFGR